MRTKNDQRKAVIEAERIMWCQDNEVRNAHQLILLEETYSSLIAGFVCGAVLTFLVMVVIYGCYAYARMGV